MKRGTARSIPHRPALRLELPNARSKPIEAVIFDLDGTLVDTMPYHHRAWEETMLPHNIAIGPLDVYEYEGVRGEEFAEHVMQRAGRPAPFSPAEATRRCNAAFKRICRIDFCPGALDALEFLKCRSIRIGLVTGSSNIEEKFEAHEFFLDYLNVIITGADVARGKPAPDPFLLCRDRLGIPAEHCLAIENAPLGVRSAREAGLDCIAVLGSSPLGADRLRDAGATMVVQSLTEILGLFRPVL